MIKYQTEQRKILLSLFEKDNHKSYSVNEIVSAISDAGISPSAIYRNLKYLEKDGIICKINDPKQSEARYHYLSPHDCVGVIHLKCEVCDEIYHLNRHVSDMIFALAKDDVNFFLNKSGAFLYGKCGNCSQIDRQK